MALDGNRLGDAMKNAVLALYSEPVSTADAAKLQAFWRAVGNQIVSEFTGHAVVNPGSLAITPSNIVDGNSHTCTGNGSVTTGTGTVS